MPYIQPTNHLKKHWELILSIPIIYYYSVRGITRRVVANVMDYNILIIEFDLKSRYYVYFWTNTRGKIMGMFISPAIHYIIHLLTFYMNEIGFK